MYESRISKELHRRVFELTLALYRVTDFFPQGEALRKQLREKANEIFGDLSEYGYAVDREREAVGVFAKIEAMRGYLNLARGNRFVRSINIAVLLREYDFLADFFMRELEGTKESTENKKSQGSGTDRSVNVTHEEQSYDRERKRNKKTSDKTIQKGIRKREIDTPVNDRQKKILSHLKEANQAKISDFSVIFNEISSKTIQRDLQDLVLKNMVKKEGDKRWTIYQLHDNVL